jgi:hypothetical protein
MGQPTHRRHSIFCSPRRRLGMNRRDGSGKHRDHRNKDESTEHESELPSVVRWAGTSRTARRELTDTPLSGSETPECSHMLPSPVPVGCQSSPVVLWFARALGSPATQLAGPVAESWRAGTGSLSPGRVMICGRGAVIQNRPPAEVFGSEAAANPGAPGSRTTPTIACDGTCVVQRN